MRNDVFAREYIVKATKRLTILPVLLNEESYADVIREAQELVELALKGMLRYIGIEPPKWHDVGRFIVENKAKFPNEIAKNANKLAKISKKLRKDRELSFYGDIDFIPSEEYSEKDAKQAIKDAEFVVEQAKKVISYRREEK